MIRIANAPCSWGVLEFGLEGKAAAYSQVLDEMSSIGYAGTELGDWGFMPTDPKKLRHELEWRNLVLLGAFVPVDLSNPDAHAQGESNALRTARLLAEVSLEGPFIVLADENGKNPIRTKYAGRIQAEHGLGAEGWSIFAAGAERIAHAVLHQTGLRTVFHHHCAGFVETPTEIEQLMTLTDPGLLGLCLDTGHYAFGGGNPVEAVRKYKERIWHFHLKDHDHQIAVRSRASSWDYFQSVRQGIFCELGNGDVNFPAVISGLIEIGYDGWAVVEQDVLPGMGTPKESARRNWEYLKKIGL
jgi:inosose dehydratase